MSTTPDPATDHEAEYVLAILRGETPTNLLSVDGYQWPDIIEALRARGYEIRETAGGYQLVGAGHDGDGTGYSALTTYPPVNPEAIHRQQGNTGYSTFLPPLPAEPSFRDLDTSISRAREALGRDDFHTTLPEPRPIEVGEHSEVL